MPPDALRLLAVAVLLACAPVANADDWRTLFGGHTKLRVVSTNYPTDSLFRDLYGASATEVQGDLRINLSARKSGWSFSADYQLAALHGESAQIPNDDSRWLQLTDIVHEGSKSAVLHRLDRLWVGHSSEKIVLRLGRQALSWGNGLFYAPMDLVNPFNPAAIDTEYKAGDDMLYGQYLRDNGADVQAAYVVRRNAVSGDVENQRSTFAAKYHGFAQEIEFDVLLARHYDDDVVGLGASGPLGGAVWGVDLVYTDTSSASYTQVVANINYSWNWLDHNMTGALEFFYNGFGIRDGEYSPAELLARPDLLRRLNRGETFALGKNYLAANVTIEMTPLWTLSPTLLANLADPSALLQLNTNYSLSDNMTLLGSIGVPLGATGSEFSGIDSGIPDRYLSSDATLFAQFAWYF